MGRRKGRIDDPGLTMPVHYVRQIAEQVRSRGVDVSRWLQLAGLSEGRLDAPGLTFSFAQFHQLVLDAIAMTREPALGLFVGQRLEPSAHGILGYAALHSATIRQALDLTERFVPLRISLLTVSHEVRGRDVRVRFQETHPLGEIRRPLLEAVVLSVKNLLDDISMGACQVREAVFPFEAPVYAALARDLFHCEVRYGQPWAGFVIPACVLDAPLKLADPEAFRQAAQICQRELDKLAENESLAAGVRRMLLEQQNGFPSLQVVARQFHLTPRTLHRRLLNEGTSYREILEAVRRTLAVEHVKSGRFTMEEIAYRLGYSDLANFRRAFKRWENVAPTRFRRRLTAGRKASSSARRRPPGSRRSNAVPRPDRRLP